MQQTMHHHRTWQGMARRLIAGALVVGTLATGGAGGLLPTPVAAAAQSYTVRPGDTLRAIAARFGVSVGAIVQANGITNPDLIRVGQVLIIPDGNGAPAAAPASPPAPTPPPATPATTGAGQTRVTVRAGQTLGQIARDHGVTVGSIVAINDIPNPDSLRIGQVLTIPAGGTPPARSAPATTTAPSTANTGRPAGLTRTFAVTMYCLRGHTANGEAVHVGGASADWSVLPEGTWIYVEGLGTFRINDHYDRDLGRLRLDVWEPSCQRAIEWGIRRVNVTVLDR